MLSWDLHIHPGRPGVRWGDGLDVWKAAAAAGVDGFVWKSHDEHTARLCSSLPNDGPVAIGSATMNAGPAGIVEALEDGARWLWGPSRDASGRLGWELALPSWWDELRAELDGAPTRFVLATAHLGADGRAELARAAAELPGAVCSITHAQFVPARERAELAAAGCVLEFDLYTCVHHQEGLPRVELADELQAVLGGSGFAYVTSDAGQAHVGDPFAFSARALDALAGRLDADAIELVARTNPARLAARVLGRAE